MYLTPTEKDTMRELARFLALLKRLDVFSQDLHVIRRDIMDAVTGWESYRRQYETFFDVETPDEAGSDRLPRTGKSDIDA